MSTTNFTIFILAAVVMQLFIALQVTCQWPQQKFDEFRTSRFNFRKSHANWENGNILPGADSVYFDDFKNSLVFSSKQGMAFGLIYDSQHPVRLVRVDLSTGLSTSFTNFPGLPALVSAEQLTQGILTPAEQYVNVLSLNFTYPVIVKFNTLNHFTIEYKVLKDLQNAVIYDSAYSERHDILVLFTDSAVLGIKLTSFDVVWQVPNQLGQYGNILLVPNEYNNGDDMVYIGSSNNVQRFRVLTGQATSRVFSNQKFSIVSMSYLGIPGWITVASVDREISGGDYLSIINVDKNFGTQAQILFHPWVSNAGDCSSPTGNFTKVDANNFIFDISLVCKDAKTRTNLIGITSTASSSGSIDIKMNYYLGTDGYGLAAIGNGISLVKSNDYLLIGKTGQLNKKIVSTIEVASDYIVAVSTNGKLYSVCSNSGTISMESVDY